MKKGLIALWAVLLTLVSAFQAAGFGAKEAPSQGAGSVVTVTNDSGFPVIFSIGLTTEAKVQSAIAGSPQIFSPVYRLEYGDRVDVQLPEKKEFLASASVRYAGPLDTKVTEGYEPYTFEALWGNDVDIEKLFSSKYILFKRPGGFWASRSNAIDIEFTLRSKQSAKPAAGEESSSSSAAPRAEPPRKQKEPVPATPALSETEQVLQALNVDMSVVPAKALKLKIIDFAARYPHLVLGVAEDATASEIKKAYFKLNRMFHPDKYSGDLGRLPSQAINVAKGTMDKKQSSSSSSSADFASGDQPQAEPWNVPSFASASAASRPTREMTESGEFDFYDSREATPTQEVLYRLGIGLDQIPLYLHDLPADQLAGVYPYLFLGVSKGSALDVLRNALQQRKSEIKSPETVHALQSAYEVAANPDFHAAFVSQVSKDRRLEKTVFAQLGINPGMYGDRSLRQFAQDEPYLVLGFKGSRKPSIEQVSNKYNQLYSKYEHEFGDVIVKLKDVFREAYNQIMGQQ